MINPIRRAAVGAAICLVSVSLVSCSAKLNAEEEKFLEWVKTSQAVYPGSPMAEAHPHLLTKHLSWTWPDDQTLLSQGNALCDKRRENSRWDVTTSTSLTFLRDYDRYQKIQLWDAAAHTLCPDFGIP